MVLDQVHECHQELAIIDLAFDSKLGDREAMSRVDNIWEVHIALVELAEYVAGRLSRRSVFHARMLFVLGVGVMSTLKIFKKRTKDQVFGWLRSIFTVAFIDEAVVQHLLETHGAGVSDIFMGFLEE